MTETEKLIKKIEAKAKMTQQETNEIFIQVLATARLMRAAQRRYFKQRDNLNECKRLEAELDRLISEPPATNNQQELFK